MKFWSALVAALFFLSSQAQAKDRQPGFVIDFLCCGEYVNCWDPAYSNAVLKAVFPYFGTFARKLDLPVPRMKDIKTFMPANVRKSKDDIRGGMELKDGTSFAFEDGHVFAYSSPNCYFYLQNLLLYEKAWGTPRMTKEQAVELARRAIKRLGYSLEDTMAEWEPFVPPLEQVGTNILPRYRIKWLAPDGRKVTEVEVNAEKKRIESIRFNNIVALKRPNPKVRVEPAPLDPNNHWQRVWIHNNDQPNDINHEYAYRLAPVVFKAAEDWARKFDFNLPLPITTNHVKRFYCSNNGGVPYVELTLTNNWEFTYRVNCITYAGSPRRFFESENLPFRVKDFVGKWNLTEDQAIDLARQTVAKFGGPPGFLRVDKKPRVRRPTPVGAMPTIPRLWIEWRYPPDPQKRVEQWIELEIDCNKGTVEMIHFDDVRLWDKPPDLGVSIDPPKSF